MAFSFVKALPVWLHRRELEVHLRVQFKATVPQCPGCVAKIATSGMYQLWVNGQFVSYGPARAGRGHFRVDEIPVGHLLTQEQNTVIIEVAGYNTNSFALMNQPSFLLSELADGNEVLAATGTDFTARVNPYYIQKAPRYSYQRPMVESYRNLSAEDSYFTDPAPGPEVPAEVPGGILLPRLAPYPIYEKLEAQPFHSGSVSRRTVDKPYDNRYFSTLSPHLVAFPLEELESCAIRECQDMVYTHDSLPGTAITENRYRSYVLPWNASGFITAKVHCHTPVRLYIQFDELCDENGQVDYLRLNCANAIRYDLCPGSHTLQLFEVYTMKYLQLVVTEGSCDVESVGLTEFKHPPVALQPQDDPRLEAVARAALENYRQNAVDIFMDCPSRERAGWLCDSRFTGRTEYFLTGDNRIEKSFLENLLHEDVFRSLPEGVFPMCYPSDHDNGEYIPQYHFHLILELGEYFERTADAELVRRFRAPLERTLRFFEGYENSDGLLEKLDKWCFIEWSRANDLVQDVNYPTNMLYSAALRTAARLYDRPDWLAKAEHVKQEVLRQAWNGTFFVDNAKRVDGELVIGTESTEVCQYYAIAFGMVTPQSHPDFFETLVRDFGPHRENTGKWPEIATAAPFIGFYLRLDTLMQYGYYEQVRENILGYFYPMAQRTGTLWEFAGTGQSCNHGFTSYILCWLDQLRNV